MRTSLLLGTTLAVSLFSAIASPPMQAVPLPDGTVAFAQPPWLISSTVTRNEVLVSGATYYFTIAVPEDAGEPLQRVTVTQQHGTTFDRRVRFEPEESFAFEGTRGDRGEPLSLGETSYDRDTRTVAVTFEPPVPPGTTVTLGLRPVRNPERNGVYLFGVTAFPVGEMAAGQFLGYGRFNFYGAQPN
jgi:Protein of unknown function (DUF2808)